MNSKHKTLSVIFVAAAFILYVLFIFFKTVVPFVALEYFGILFCLFFSFVIIGQPADTWFVRIGLSLTAIADLFLLVLGGPDWAGVGVFILVQLIYATRLLTYTNPNKIWLSLNVRLLFIVLFQIIGLILVQGEDLLFVITCFYFANLVTNVVFAFASFKFNRLFAIGLLLFMLCDIFVGLNNASAYLILSPQSLFYKLINLPIDLMWFFYYPAQVLITLSILTVKKAGNHDGSFRPLI